MLHWYMINPSPVVLYCIRISVLSDISWVVWIVWGISQWWPLQLSNIFWELSRSGTYGVLCFSFLDQQSYHTGYENYRHSSQTAFNFFLFIWIIHHARERPTNLWVVILIKYWQTQSPTTIANLISNDKNLKTLCKIIRQKSYLEVSSSNVFISSDYMGTVSSNMILDKILEM